MWSHSPILLVELPMDTMEPATPHLNVPAREELPLAPVPHLLESVVSSPFLVEAAAVPTTPMQLSLLIPPVLILTLALTHFVKLILMSAS